MCIFSLGCNFVRLSYQVKIYTNNFLHTVVLQDILSGCKVTVQKNEWTTSKNIPLTRPANNSCLFGILSRYFKNFFPKMLIIYQNWSNNDQNWSQNVQNHPNFVYKFEKVPNQSSIYANSDNFWQLGCTTICTFDIYLEISALSIISKSSAVYWKFYGNIVLFPMQIFILWLRLFGFNVFLVS